MKLLVAAMFVALAFSGCVDDDAYVPDEADACVVTAADDFDSCAAKEEGLTRNEVAHRHDYWQGQDRITVLEASLDDERYGAGLISNCGARPGHVFALDDGFTVIQGTQYVEITMDWGDEAYDNFGDTELWIRTAGTTEIEYVGPIANGETYVFESTNADNDLPHSLISAWQIGWYIYPGDENDPECNSHHWSSFDISVDIVNGLEIPLFPGHPDHWDNGNITEMTIMEESREVNFYNGDDSMSGICLGGCLWNSQPWIFNNGSIVPYDTQEVVVRVDVQPSVQGHTLGFQFHGADTRELTKLDPTSTDGTVQIYEIDIERIQADGPYNRQTLWEIWVYPTNDDGTFRGEIDITITVHKETG